MAKDSDNSYKILSQAIRQLILRPELSLKLKTLDTRGDAIKQLGITEEMVTEVLNILNVIEGKGDSAKNKSTKD